MTADTVELPPIGFGACNVLGASFVEVVEAAERHGFQRFTVNPVQYARSQAAGWTDDAIRRRVIDAGLECTMVDALAGVLPGLRSGDESGTFPMPDDHPSVQRCIEIAANLGVRVLNVTHYWGDPATGVGELAGALASVCGLVATHGMEISVEFIPGTGIPDLSTASEVAWASGASNIGVLVDVFHHARSGGTVDDIRRLPAGTLTALQLSDRRSGGTSSTHVPVRGRALPGHGQLPLAELVQAALINNPRATIDVEVLNDELSALEPDDVARILAASVRSWTASFSDLRPR